MLAGLIKPTSGKVVVNGWALSEYPNKAKAVMGFIPDRPFLYEKLTALEFLRFIAGLYNLSSNGVEERIQSLFELFGLSEWQNELIESFSHGMKQRVVMASAFIHQPKVLVVDEPMVGLDPQGARLVKKVFREFCNEGGSLFMSTHTLEVAEEVCDRIAIIQAGKIIAVGTMKELREKAGGEDKKLESIFLTLTGGEEIKKVVRALRG
jgi:ABC-2 type transport system ATP-binding protein